MLHPGEHSNVLRIQEIKKSAKFSKDVSITEQLRINVYSVG